MKRDRPPPGIRQTESLQDVSEHAVGAEGTEAAGIADVDDVGRPLKTVRSRAGDIRQQRLPICQHLAAISALTEQRSARSQTAFSAPCQGGSFYVERQRVDGERWLCRLVPDVERRTNPWMSSGFSREARNSGEPRRDRRRTKSRLDGIIAKLDELGRRDRGRCRAPSVSRAPPSRSRGDAAWRICRLRIPCNGSSEQAKSLPPPDQS